MAYKPSEDRYKTMKYRRCGKSGLLLPAISLGLWHNFGHVDEYENGKKMMQYAFDQGITHFDLANNYGPPPGSAEENFGKMLKEDLMSYRDEMIISTKAGYHMWEGPYGDWGSRKYILSSLDQSLKRMGLEYVDIFYHHRPDPNTPIEESALALDHAVKQGKALYVGVSNYKPEQTAEIAKIFKELKTPFVIHQPRYSMFDRWVEDGLLDTLASHGVGSIVFSPLAQGLLTDKYLKGIPKDSRAAKDWGFLKSDHITEEKINKVLALQEVAESRGQTISQLAIAWLLRNDVVTSVLIGASSVEQLKQNLASIDNIAFSQQELDEIEKILKG
ncbi:L-glyceraldehyde 3-phosphate reductase [Reichenbachiella carrageenanivorans]|uniref:L-glyceraldehyde 3-phosphate reductase n=1 Tax=Reichenbachiella carrageenanivorans TaxID=2979869 RepID=A0ABY6D076_9BACT|nr:L-glyceraldehyde 3-phosphate reductase [Reichenbachiella carrageenanivorans]UXX79099.1 L-glyceraldehyde 3-phosphate reductase [Reichenbachiella carrageenanivorans]